MDWGCPVGVIVSVDSSGLFAFLGLRFSLGISMIKENALSPLGRTPYQLDDDHLCNKTLPSKSQMLD